MSKTLTRNPERQARLDAKKRGKKFRRLIRTFNDPVLKVICEPIEPASKEAAELAKAMTSVLESFDNGVGLAAPQIGATSRMIVVWANRFNQVGSVPMVMVNPEILRHSESFVSRIEGCLSYPGKEALIDRWTTVSVRFYGLDGNESRRLFEDFEACVIQHEIDHLNGVCRVGEQSCP